MITVRLDPSGSAEGLDRPAGGQVDLSSRGAPRRDGPTAGPHPQLPGRRRHELHAGRRSRRSARSSNAARMRSSSAAPGCAPAPGRRTASIDVGNAGTLMRLLPGWLAAQHGGSPSRSTGMPRSAGVPSTASPRRCARWAHDIHARRRALPAVHGHPGHRLHGIDYALPVASAQVKSCLLFAAMPPTADDVVSRAAAATTPSACWRGPASDTREASVERRRTSTSSRCRIRVVPSDPSPAAFPSPRRARAGSHLSSDFGVNWTRTGSSGSLRRMGGIVLGDLEEAHGRPLDSGPASRSATSTSPHGPLIGDGRRGRRRCRWRSTSCRWSPLLGCFADGETVVTRRAGAARRRNGTGSPPSSTALNGLGGDTGGHQGRLHRARHRGPEGRHDRLRAATIAWRCSGR